MKVSPKADYPVRVERPADDVPAGQARHYEGIYTAVLNHQVTIDFVPDVSTAAPPWDDHLLPVNLDLVVSVEQARVETVLFARYAVTPNTPLAGQVEQAGVAPTRGWVRYVQSAEFDRFALELSRLYDAAFDRFSGPTVSQLLEYEVVRFIAEEIVASRWLDPYHAMMLGRSDHNFLA